MSSKTVLPILVKIPLLSNKEFTFNLNTLVSFIRVSLARPKHDKNAKWSFHVGTRQMDSEMFEYDYGTELLFACGQTIHSLIEPSDLEATLASAGVLVNRIQVVGK